MEISIKTCWMLLSTPTTNHHVDGVGRRGVTGLFDVFILTSLPQQWAMILQRPTGWGTTLTGTQSCKLKIGMRLALQALIELNQPTLQYVWTISNGWHTVRGISPPRASNLWFQTTSRAAAKKRRRVYGGRQVISSINEAGLHGGRTMHSTHLQEEAYHIYVQYSSAENVVLWMDLVLWSVFSSQDKLRVIYLLIWKPSTR